MEPEHCDNCEKLVETIVHAFQGRDRRAGDLAFHCAECNKQVSSMHSSWEACEGVLAHYRQVAPELVGDVVLARDEAEKPAPWQTPLRPTPRERLSGLAERLAVFESGTA